MKKVFMLTVLITFVLGLNAQEVAERDLSVEIAHQFPVNALAYDRANPVYIDIVNKKEDLIDSLEISFAVTYDNKILVWNKTFDRLNLKKGEQKRLRFDNLEVPNTEDDVSLLFLLKKVNGIKVGEEESAQILSHNLARTSTSVDMTVFAEMFSSSTCGPCATWNTNVYAHILPQLNFNVPGSKRTIAKNQVPIPAPGDPSINSYTAGRRGLYNANSAPRMYVQGQWVDYSQATLQSWTDAQDYFADIVDDAASTPAFVTIKIDEFTQTASGNNIEINVKGEIEAFSNFSGQNIRLNVFVLNKDYTFSNAQNGDVNYKHITRAVMPDDIGMRVLNFNTGTTISFDETVTLLNQNGVVTPNTTNLWNDRVEIVVIVQNRSNRDVLQAAYANEFLSNESFSTLENNIKLYPNPANDHSILTFVPQQNGLVNIEVLSTDGKVVHQVQSTVYAGEASNVHLSTDKLSNGMYLIKIQNGNEFVTKKWNVQKP